MTTKTFKRQTSTGVMIYSMVEDNVPVILEDQRKMLEIVNDRLGLASQITLF